MLTRAHTCNTSWFLVQTKAGGKCPKQAYSTVTLKGGARKTMKAVKAYTNGIHYRKDLEGVRSPSLPCLA